MVDACPVTSTLIPPLVVAAVIVISQAEAPASEAITSLMTEPTIDVDAAFD